MEKEVDRRHGNYVPRDVVPIRDTAPSEMEPSQAGTSRPETGAAGANRPERECVQSGSPFTNREQAGRSNILSDALACTQGDRQAAYGSPAVNWGRTAKIAQAITGLDCLTPEICVKVAIAMKQARLIQTPGHRDSMVDLAGYAWVLSEVTAKTEAA